MDECLDRTGVLCSIHDLLLTVYSLWYSHVTGRKAPPPSAAMAGPSDFDAIADVEGPMPDIIPDIEGDSDGAADADVDQPQADGDDAQPKTPKDNAKDRNMAMRFLMVPSLASIVTGIHIVCTPPSFL